MEMYIKNVTHQDVSRCIDNNFRSEIESNHEGPRDSHPYSLLLLLGSVTFKPQSVRLRLE